MWGKRIQWASTAWSASLSEGNLNSVASKIQLLVSYSDVMIFMKIKHSDGEIVESRYSTANTAGAWTKARRIDKYGENIYYLMLWTKYYVFIFDNNDSEWLNYYEVSNSNLVISDLLISSDFIYFAGYFTIGGSNIGHYSKVPVGSILGDDSFSSTTATTSLLSNSDYSYEDDTNSVIASSNSTATITTTFSEDSTTFLKTHYTTTTSEISFFLEESLDNII